MKQRLIKYLLRFSYPQNIFTSSIIKFIDKDTENILVDVPCGDGITSWQFSNLNNLTVYGYDISSASIENAKNNFKGSNLHFEVADINKAIPEHTNAKYFCIINSLFLLPQPELILKALYNTLTSSSLLFIIVPNTHGFNFKWFNKRNPGINQLILDETEFSNYFSLYGWNLKSTIPLAYAHTFGRKDAALFSVLGSFYLTTLNYFQTIFKIQKPNYYLIILSKK